METSLDPAQRAAAMRRRAADWAAGEDEARAFERRRMRAMTVAERLAEAADLNRQAELLRASVRPQRPA